MFVKDNQSHLLIVNDAFCKMFNLSRIDILGKTLAEDVTPAEREIFLRIDKEVLATGIENVNEESLTLKDHETRIVSTKKTRFIDDNGDKFLIGIIRDITESKNTEKNNNMLRSLVETSGDFIGLASLEGIPFYLNNEGKQMVGLDINEPLPNNVGAFFPKEYQETISNVHIPTIYKENKWHGEAHFIHFKTGNLIPIEMSGFLIKDNLYKKPIAIGVVATNITNRKKAELKLKESEKSLVIAQKIAKTGSFNLDLKTKKIDGSSAFMEILSIDKKSEFTADTWKALIHPEDINENLEKFQACIETGNKFDMEFRIFTKNKKTLKWIHGLGEIKFIDGEPINFFGTAQDITDRKKHEIELKLAKDFSDKLIMSMQEGLIIVNLEGKILLVNNSFSKILGYSKEELIGMELPYPFAKLEDFEKIGKTNERITDGETLSFEFEFIKKSGKHFLASFSTGNIKNDKGEVIALFGTMKDVSEEQKAKKILEEIAIKSIQKKDVILKLAGHISEDFNTSIKKITKEAATTLNVERVSIWSFNSEKTEIFCEDLYVSKSDKNSKGAILKYSDNPDYFKALDKNKNILVKDVLNNPITKKFAENYFAPNNIASLMDVFINSTDGFYGIICFEHVGDPRVWTPDEQEFAISITNIVSLMLQGAERKLAEDKITSTNELLTKANKELNVLRDQLEQENVYLRNELDLVFNYEDMIYGSTAFSNVLTEVEKVAPTNATVLLLGESGTGKELLARALHTTSLRNKKPLIKVNCSAIPRELIESELFGHKKGSFTGAFSDKIGKFEMADGGTLFLDEIGELPLDMQPKILRFLQEGEIEVVGGVDLKKLNVRVIAATNRNLKEEVEKKQFREDLFFRLNVFPIEVPPLRKRKDDIPLLVEHFVAKFNKAYEKDIRFIPDGAMEQLKSYKWPGNVRELENLIERASILSSSDTLIIPGFETSAQQAKQLINNNDTSLNTIQRNHILQILEHCNWKISGHNGASNLLDIKPSTLRDKMAKLDIKKPKK